MKTRLRLRPREPNRIASVHGLLRSWDFPQEAHAKTFAISEAGNINFAGVVAGSYAHIFTPGEPEFEAAIEPGVRPLVLAAVCEGGLVTYTSCQGHGYADSELNSECHIGILPRTRRELHRAWTAFKRVTLHDGDSLQVSSLAIYPWHLFDEHSQREVPVVDLYLHCRTTVDFNGYLEQLSLDARLVAGTLRAEFSRRRGL